MKSQIGQADIVTMFIVDDGSDVGPPKDIGPIKLPWIPRRGDIMDGEWFGDDEGTRYEVERVYFCVPADHCDEPHVTLAVSRLKDGESPRQEELEDDLRTFLKAQR